VSAISQQQFLGPLSFLVCGLPEKQRRERLLLMMVAHIDDSGSSGKNSHVMVLAGYLARAEDWNVFSDKWRKVLDATPTVKYFRTAQAHRLKEQFLGQSEHQRDERVKLLEQIIVDTKPIAVACVLWWKDFLEFKRLFENPIQAYSVMFNRIIWKLMLVMKERFPGEQIEIIFDDQGALGTKAASLNDRLMLALSPQVKNILAGRPVHRSDEFVLPLQAADMLAWHLRRNSNSDQIDPTIYPPLYETFPLNVTFYRQSS